MTELAPRVEVVARLKDDEAWVEDKSWVSGIRRAESFE
jgi:hypothetical protein